MNMNYFSLIQTVIRRVAPLRGTFTKQLAICIIFSCILFVFSGCTGNSSPSDKDAINMVSEYYLYYVEGEKIGASIVKRKEFNDSCKCYPITFNIHRSKATSGIKTFYFIKEPSGKFSLKKYANAVKT